MKKIFTIFSLIIIFSLVFTGCSCTQTPPTQIKAVWWWNDEFNETETTTYLNFLKENNVNQIYYCSSKFNNETEEFILKANNLNISVFWLDGNYKWLHSSTEEEKLHNKISKYQEYNTQHPNAKFAGIHLDIEPHQSKNSDNANPESQLPDSLNFKTDIGRQNLISSLITLAHNLKTTYTNINFSYDIPFWLHDEITFNNKKLPAYKHLINIADNVVVMSYRDSAEKIYDVAKEELTYAESVNKTITLSVECGTEEDAVTFMQEGKQVLNNELEKLKSFVPNNTGICIHHIKTWFNLQD